MSSSLEKREDLIRSGSLAFRRRLPPMSEPTYAFGSVNRARPLLVGSEVTKIEGRHMWLPHLAEMLLLCNEASKRQHARGLSAAMTGGSKPLSLEYLADRLDTDDPLWGFTVRRRQPPPTLLPLSSSSPTVAATATADAAPTAAATTTSMTNTTEALTLVSPSEPDQSDSGGELQGFVTVTTFTTWCRWFRWESMSEVSGLTDFHKEVVGLGDPAQRRVDSSCRLARSLEASVRAGDPEGEGVIWPHVAEVSLLGGLGCGKCLVEAVVDQLQAHDSPYHFLVLQATENAIPFYEACGFVRVGAVAKYSDLDPKLAARRAEAEKHELTKNQKKRILHVLDALMRAPAAAATKKAPPDGGSNLAAGAEEAEGKLTAVAGVGGGVGGVGVAMSSSSSSSSLVALLAEAFLSLPSKKELPDYYTVVKEPISFTEMRAKALRGDYDALQLADLESGKAQKSNKLKGNVNFNCLERDLRLMFNNAKAYNSAGSRVWLDAERLERAAATLFNLASNSDSSNSDSSNSESVGVVSGQVKAVAASCLRSSQELGLAALSNEVAAVEASSAFWRQLKVDLAVDTRDSKRGHWLKGKVVGVDDEAGRCKVHFQGWAKKWDEWYPKDSDQLAPAGTHTDQVPAVVEEVKLAGVGGVGELNSALLKARAVRVKAGQQLAVTATVDPRSKRLGTLPSGMVVAVSDRHFKFDAAANSSSSVVERIFFEQTSNPSVPAKGWVTPFLGELLAVDIVKAKGLGPVTHDSTLAAAARNSGAAAASSASSSASSAFGALAASSLSSLTEGTGSKRGMLKRRRGITGQGQGQGAGPAPLDPLALAEAQEQQTPTLLGLGAMGGCSELRWHVCEPDDTCVSVASRVAQARQRRREQGRRRVQQEKQQEGTGGGGGGEGEASSSSSPHPPSSPHSAPSPSPSAPPSSFLSPEVTAFDLVFLNQHMYPSLTASSKMKGGTRLRIPRPKTDDDSDSDGDDLNGGNPDDDEVLSPLSSSSGPSSSVVSTSKPATPTCMISWHECKENDTPKMVATQLLAAHWSNLSNSSLVPTAQTESSGGGLDRASSDRLIRDLALSICALNVKKLEGLQPGSRLRRGTKLRLPRVKTKADQVKKTRKAQNSGGEGEDDGENEEDLGLDALWRDTKDAWQEDVEVVAYRHWTFPDDENIEDTHASYMMVKPLVHRKKSQAVGPTTKAILEAAAALQQQEEQEEEEEKARVEEAAAAAAAEEEEAAATAAKAAAASTTPGLVGVVDGGEGSGGSTDASNEEPSSGRKRSSRATASAASEASSPLPPPSTSESQGVGGDLASSSLSLTASLMSAPVVACMEACLRALTTCTARCEFSPKGKRLRCEIFLELPPKKLFPDYYALIKEPVCLRGFEKRVHNTKVHLQAQEPPPLPPPSSASTTTTTTTPGNGSAGSAKKQRKQRTPASLKSSPESMLQFPPFADLDAFSDALQTLFDNARQYNLPDSLVYVDAEEMEILFGEALAEHSAALLATVGGGKQGADKKGQGGVTVFAGTDAAKGDLFNKVVSVGPARDGSSLDPKYELYFVLTYIPDLQWCRLGPMEVRGAFGGGGGQHKGSGARGGGGGGGEVTAGQPRWMLARGDHLEVDVSAVRCKMVKVRAMKHTIDADAEEWMLTDINYRPVGADAHSSPRQGGADATRRGLVGPDASGEHDRKDPSSKRKNRGQTTKYKDDSEEDDEFHEDDDEWGGGRSKGKSKSKPRRAGASSSSGSSNGFTSSSLPLQASRGGGGGGSSPTPSFGSSNGRASSGYSSACPSPVTLVVATAFEATANHEPRLAVSAGVDNNDNTRVSPRLQKTQQRLHLFGGVASAATAAQEAVPFALQRLQYQQKKKQSPLANSGRTVEGTSVEVPAKKRPRVGRSP